MKRRLILVVGMPGSGKTLVTRIAEKLNIKTYVMGDIVREEATRRGLPHTPENLNRIASELRQLYGKDVIARRVLERLIRDDPRVALIDGVRSLVEVKVFMEVGEVIIIAVHASPRTRFERIRRRQRPGDPSTWEEFVARDLTELDFGVGAVIALADYMLVNEGDVSEFQEKAQKLLGALARGETPAPTVYC